MPEKKEVMPVISGKEEKKDESVHLEPLKKRRKISKNIFNKFGQID